MGIRIFFFSFLCLFSTVSFAKERAEAPLGSVVVDRILADMSKDKLSSFESQLCSLLEELKQDGYVSRQGDDATLRPLFVTAQGLIEDACTELLHERKIAKVCGAIHTPCPATPLCTDGAITEKLVDKSLEKDPTRLVTVTFRAKVVRDYLRDGGVLYVVYPKGGELKRTEQQMAIYHHLLAAHPKSLFDTPLDRPLPPMLIGATYRIIRGAGDEVIFGIGGVQANDPADGVTWRLWLGDPTVSHVCMQRIQAVESLMGRALK